MIHESPSLTKLPAEQQQHFKDIYTRSLNTPDGFNLRDALGEEHWQKMTAQLRVYPEVYNVHNDINYEQLLLQLLTAHPMHVIDLLGSGNIYVYGNDIGLPDLDDQLLAIAGHLELPSIPLSTVEQMMTTLHAHIDDVRKTATADDLKTLIDKGGVEFLGNYARLEREAYFHGNEHKLLMSYLDHRTQLLEKEDRLLLSEANRNWIGRGIIQEKCRQGEVCFIHVGYLHLLVGEDNLINLLRQEGFKVKRQHLRRARKRQR